VFTEFDRNIAVSFDLNITVSQWPNFSELNTLAGAVNVKKNWQFIHMFLLFFF